MKKIFFVLAFLLLCISVFAEYVIQEPAQRCDPEDFSLMPWGIYGNDREFDSFYQEMYECGFNVTPFCFPEYTDKAKAHNLKLSLYADHLIDSSIQDEKEKYADWAEKVKKAVNGREKDIYQIYVQDEPLIKDYDRLKAKSGAVRSVLGKRPYINFLSKHIVEKYQNISHYDYCHKFIDDCGLDYVSHDSYCFTKGIGFEEDRFYSDLESIKNIAKAHNRNFANIIVSVAAFNYSLPDDFSINIQGWSTLAYGGRGLSYFAFERPDLGNYRAAAYYQNGSRASLWYIIRDMNFDIHNIMPYYRNLKAVNQFHIGYIPKDARGMETAKIVKKLETAFDNDEMRGKKYPHPEKANLLVGEFAGSDGNEYAIIVNKDSYWSVYISDFEFKNAKKYTHVSSTNSRKPERDFSGEDRWIAPGHGILLKGEISKDMKFDPINDWKFIKDKKNEGEKKGYFRTDFDYKNWTPIDVNCAWENTIGDYDGYGWYKTQTEFKDSEKIYLFFGAADEDAWVYVNGKLVLDHSRAALGLTGNDIWDMPFAIDIKPYLKEGRNDISVKVKDDMKAGGIWRGVYAVYTDKDKTAEDIVNNYTH